MRGWWVSERKKWKSLSWVWLFTIPWTIFSPWNSPGQNTGVGSLSLLQGIFLTQGSNPGLLHYRWILYQLIHKESPRILEWVANPFSSGSFRSRNWIGASSIAGRFFTKKDTPKSCNKNLQVNQISTWMYPSLQHQAWSILYRYFLRHLPMGVKDSPMDMFPAWFLSGLIWPYMSDSHVFPTLN